MEVDLATITCNVAQIFLTDHEWTATLLSIRNVFGDDGHLVSRCAIRAEWRGWNGIEANVSEC